MPTASIETYLRNAREQTSQRDINESMLRALGEIAQDLKRLESEIHRVRREVQMGRRFG